MSSCDESNISKNYIVQTPTDFDILSACTGFYTNNIYNCTGDTLTLHSTTVSANTVNASVYLSGGTNLLDIFGSLDNYTTGATLVGSTAYFDRSDTLSAYTLDLSSLDVSDTYITAFTYDNANTFTISDNSGSTFSATINNVTGLTVNGGLSATTISACTGIYTSNLYGCSPVTVHDNLQHISSSATGINSIAWGTGTTASGNYSHAEGQGTIAGTGHTSQFSGVGYISGSHAEGVRTVAIGGGSHAEGVETTATTFNIPPLARGGSHAEGFRTISSGGFSHAEGRETTASGFGSHAEGKNTTASGSYSHAEGRLTTASSNYSHAEGLNTTASGMMSHAEGNNTTASGKESHAEGYGTTASGYNSHAEGKNTTASGRYDHAEGYNTTASGGYGSHAEGFGTTSSGYMSHAEGVYSTASGGYSHAEGYSTTASGYSSHAEGRFTVASNLGSHAEGDSTTASGTNSHAEGNNTKSIGSGSHAEGRSTTASGQDSHAEGFWTTSSGFASHAGGRGVNTGNKIVASGDTSFVHFRQTTFSGNIGAYGDYSVILGGNDHNIGTGSTSSGIFAGSGNTISDDVLRTVVLGGSDITGVTNDTVYIPYLNINLINNDNSLTQILSRDSSDGIIKYRDVQSIISAATSQDTFVTGFTYDGVNTFTIIDNSGSTFNASINVLSATTISATTFYGDGSQLSGIPHTTDTFISGGTYIDGGITYNSNSIDLDNNTGGTVTITNVRDTYLTGQTFNESNYEITSTLNDGTSLISDLSILSTDMVVTGGTYDINNGVVTFTNNSGGTFNVSGFTSGMTDSFTVAANISASTESITFDNNLTGSNFYNVSLTPLLSGKTNNTTFNTYTSDTQTILDSKVEDGANVGSGTGEIFSGKSGTTLNFRTLSGGSNTTLTTVGDVVKIDVAVPSGDNFFSTAGTVTQSATTSDPNISLQIVGNTGFAPYSITGITDTFVSGFTFSSNTFTITQNDGSSFDSSVETIELGNILSAVTFDIGTSGSISATTFNGDTFSGGTFYGDGSNLTGITDNDKFITGFTYDNSNNLTISRNDGTGFTTNISTMSGLTVNGTLSATTLDGGTILSGGTNLLTIIDDRDTFVTGTTFTSNQSILSRNDGSDVLKISGGTNVTITSGGTNLTVIDVSIPLDSNTFVTGGTYNPSTVDLDFSGNTGFLPFSVDVSALKDDTNTFVTGFTYDDINTFTITDNTGSAFTATINVLSATTISGGTLFGDGSNLTGISTENTTITGFTYNDANTFTISDSSGTTFAASINIMTGLTVNGESVFSGTGTDVVQIYGSGDTTPILRVEGSAGELFSITDSLTGELFAVNNISAETILSVNSDNTILWGDPTVPSLNTTVKKSINSGLSEIYSIPVSAYTGGFFDYTVTGAGARAGSIMSIFSGTSVDFNETTTNDIGDTSGITFDMNISGGTANLTVSATTNSWEIRTIVRSI